MQAYIWVQASIANNVCMHDVPVHKSQPREMIYLWGSLEWGGGIWNIPIEVRPCRKDLAEAGIGLLIITIAV